MKLDTTARQQLCLIALLFLGILAPLIVFGGIANEVHEREQMALDSTILRAIHQHATPWRDPVAIVVTELGGPWAIGPLGIAVAVLLVYTGRRREAGFWVLAVGGAVVLNLLTKAIFARARPDLWVSPTPEYDYGFPSGHAMISTAVALTLDAIAWPTRGRWPAIVIGAGFTLAVSFTRLYLGVHYPTDILGGWCAALMWVCGLYLTLRRLHWWRTLPQG